VNIYPVVHINDPETATAQADIAFSAGADGVYLIDHSSNPSFADLFDTFNLVKAAHRDGFVGINPLGAGDALASLRVVEAAYHQGQLDFMPDGLWVDSAKAGVNIAGFDRLNAFRQSHPELRGVKLLGGVAFKYTSDYTEAPEAAAAMAIEAAPYLDVITTSGEGTGQPPPVAKIKAMKERSASKIAIASGISIDNVKDYQPYTDEVLVSTSVETEPYSGIFDPGKLRQLIEAAHSGKGAAGD